MSAWGSIATDPRVLICWPTSGAGKWTTRTPQYVTGASLRPRTRSHSPRNDVAVNLCVEANENNPVPSGITLVPFQLVIWYGNFGPVGNVSLSIRDDGDVTILVYLEEVSFVCVGLTSAFDAGIRFATPLPRQC
jgi:hypothetical protein